MIFVLKFHLYDKHRQLLKDWRSDKGKGYSAEEVSEMLGHHKSWLGQIERGRLVSIKDTDLTKLLSILLDIPEDKIASGDYIDNFIYNYDPFHQDDPITEKIANKITNFIPNFFGKSYINFELNEIETKIKQECERLNPEQRELIEALLSQFRDNLEKDVVLSLAFASLPYDLIFQKYKNDSDTIQKIYDHFLEYINEWIDKESE